MPLLALLLALIVFVPDVAMAGSWASPARIADMGTSTDPASIVPAQLVRPATPDLPTAPQMLLLVLATWLGAWWLPATSARLRPGAAMSPPGRFGRGALQAFLT